MKKQRSNFASSVLVAATVGGIIWVSAGDLNPPAGPVQSTMLRLDEIESRTPISSLPFTIDRCGSYFLTDCLTGVSGQNGITITADDVSLDLNGFALIGVPGSLDGVATTMAVKNLTVRNGTVRDWGRAGVNAGPATNSQLERLHASDNGANGLTIGSGSLVTQCTATGNGSNGIGTSHGCTVVDCTARDNTSSGFLVGNGSTVQNCSAFSNDNDGISTFAGCTVIGCTAAENSDDGIELNSGCTVRNCSARDNGDDGFSLSSRSTIEACTASNNTGDGIQASVDNRIVGNTCNGNGLGAGDGAGIHIISSDNHIEGNSVTDNDRGLDIDGSSNYVADNTVRSNTDNYDIAAGNQLNILLCQIPESIDWPATVTLAGSLTGVTAQHGLTILADNVTVDLNGFTLFGVPASLDGIHVSPFDHVSIYNGMIRGWGNHGIDAVSAEGCQFHDLGLYENGAVGLRGGGVCVLQNCTASYNTGDGLFVNSYSTVEACSAYRNGGHGIVAPNGAVRGCTANFNTGDGINAPAATVNECVAFGNQGNGIKTTHDFFDLANRGSVVANCTANQNTMNGILVNLNSVVSQCTASVNEGAGISAEEGSLVKDCVARDNANDGVKISDQCHAVGNTCADNGRGGSGAGVHATGTGNRIEGNHCTGGVRGLDIDGPGNYVDGNTVTGNTDNYDFVAGNQLNILLGEIPESIDWSAKVTLAGSLTGVTRKDGITINADDVTLDLNGFALIGVAGSLDGVAVPAVVSNLTVRNGTVRDWGGAGVGADSARNSLLERLRAYSNDGGGLWIGLGSLVTHCTALLNGSYGIRTKAGCVVTECIASTNTSAPGIEVNGRGCIVSKCTADNNGSHGIFAVNGISLITGCSARNNSGRGITASEGATIIDCNAASNTDDGIACGSDCRVVANNSYRNGAAGIHTTHADNRIEGNNVTDNARGIDVDATGNLIIKNTASGNATNYDIVAGNRYGPIISITGIAQPAVTGSSAAGTLTSSDPWANFSY